jgi:hypothetical protein
MAQLLTENRLTARDLSGILGISEKDVYEHLPHVEKSLGNGTSIIVEPARCRSCDFVFKKRRRLTTPGRCPVCRSESITFPVFGAASSAGEPKKRRRKDRRSGVGEDMHTSSGPSHSASKNDAGLEPEDNEE